MERHNTMELNMDTLEKVIGGSNAGIKEAPLAQLAGTKPPVARKLGGGLPVHPGYAEAIGGKCVHPG